MPSRLRPLLDLAQLLRVEPQPFAALLLEADLPDHPAERDRREIVVGVAAADVGVHAREPDLLDALGIRRAALIPEHRVEGVALVVNRDRVAGALDLPRQVLVRKAVGVEQTVDH